MIPGVLHTMLRLLLGGLLLFLLSRAAIRVADAGRLREPAGEDDPDLTLAVGLVFAALLVALATLLGALGLLDSTVAAVAGVLGVFLLSRAIPGGKREGRSHSCLRWPCAGPAGGDRVLRIAVVVVAGVAAILFVRQVGTPPMSWDALTYHLTYPAHWLHSGHLDTLHQARWNPSSTYYPLGAEQLYFWGLRITRSDWWVAVAQVPSLLLGALAVVGLGRCLGRSDGASLWAGVLWISTPVLLRQAFQAETDVWFAAWMLSGIYFAMRFRVSGRGAHLALALLAGGMAAGTKYPGLVYLPVLLGLLASGCRVSAGGGRGRPSKALLLGIAGALAVGGYVYARNLVNAGNPLLPMRLSLGGWTLFPGLLDARAYYHDPGQRLGLAAFLVSLRAFTDCGLNLLLTVLALVLAVPLALKRTSRAPERALALAALAMVVLFLGVVPYRWHRYLPPIIGLCLPLLIARDGHGRLLLGVVLLNAAFASVYVLKDIALLRLGAFSLGGVVGLALAAVGVGALVWHWSPGRRRGRLSLAVLLAVWMAVLTGGQVLYERGRFTSWERAWSHVVEAGHGFRERVDWADWAGCWKDMAARTRTEPVLIAYAGNNIPYPLFGTGLRNSVVFVPATDECASGCYDWGSAPCDLSRPGSPQAWLSRLRAADVRYLCVFRELGEGWPAEWHWAREPGAGFTTVRQSGYSAIFSR